MKKKTKIDAKFEIHINLSTEAAENYTKLTTRNIGKRIYFVINKVVLANPFINSKIENGTFSFEINEATYNEFFKD